MQELLTKKDLAEMLAMSVECARDLCHRHGVEPINVGRGKVPRLRWSRTSVMEMLDTMLASTQHAARRPSTRRTVTGMTDRQVIEKLAVHVVQ